MIVSGGLRVTDETGLVVFRADDGMGFDTALLLSIIRISPYTFQDVLEERYRGRIHDVKTLHILSAQAAVR